MPTAAVKNAKRAEKRRVNRKQLNQQQCYCCDYENPSLVFVDSVFTLYVITVNVRATTVVMTILTLSSL